MDRLSVAVILGVDRLSVAMMWLPMKIMSKMRLAMAMTFTVNEFMTVLDLLQTFVFAIAVLSFVRFVALAVISLMLFVTIAQIFTIRFVVNLMLTIARGVLSMSVGGSGFVLVNGLVGSWHFFDDMRVGWCLSFDKFIFLPEEVKSII